MKTGYAVFIFYFTIGSLLAQLPAYEGGKQPQPFQPPKSIADKFRTEYPSVTPTWHVQKNNYVADFADTTTLRGISIVYDKNGKVLRRESEMENSTYPAKINTYFVTNYPGEKFKTWKCVDENGVQSYCIKRPTGPLWFDSSGNYLDPEKKNDPTAAN